MRSPALELQSLSSLWQEHLLGNGIFTKTVMQGQDFNVWLNGNHGLTSTYFSLLLKGPIALLGPQAGVLHKMHPVAAWEKNFSRAEESLNIFIWIHSESTHYLKKTESMWFGQDLFSQTSILTVSVRKMQKAFSSVTFSKNKICPGATDHRLDWPQMIRTWWKGYFSFRWLSV